MPLYEFKCTKCGQKLEQLCKMGETGKDLICPVCQNRGLERLVSGFAAPGAGGGDKCAGCKGGHCGSC